MIQRDAGHARDEELLELAHELSQPSVRRRLLRHLRACASCEQRFLDEVRRRERLRARAGVALADPAAGAPRARSPARKLALGLSLVAALVLAWPFLAPHTARGHEPDYGLPVDAPTRWRSSGDAPDAGRLARALEAYAAGELAQARELLEGAREEGGRESARRLFLASCLARAGEEREARELLATIALEELPEPWRGRARAMQAELARSAGSPLPR